MTAITWSRSVRQEGNSGYGVDAMAHQKRAGLDRPVMNKNLGLLIDPHYNQTPGWGAAESKRQSELGLNLPKMDDGTAHKDFVTAAGTELALTAIPVVGWIARAGQGARAVLKVSGNPATTKAATQVGRSGEPVPMGQLNIASSQRGSLGIVPRSQPTAATQAQVATPAQVADAAAEAYAAGQMRGFIGGSAYTSMAAIGYEISVNDLSVAAMFVPPIAGSLLFDNKAIKRLHKGELSVSRPGIPFSQDQINLVNGEHHRGIFPGLKAGFLTAAAGYTVYKAHELLSGK